MKLVHQNLLAMEYLGKEYRAAAESGASPDLSSSVDALRTAYKVTKQHRDSLKSHSLLSPDHFDDQYKTHKQLRRMYDDWMTGKKAFAARFGTATEKLEPFDRKFEPNEGWKVFVEHFR